MPDRDESIPRSPIPRIDPARWEEYEGFRETLLQHFTEPAANTAVRGFGTLLFNLALESSGSWPAPQEGTTGSELRAALADLRHLEGFLGAVGREHILSSLDARAIALSQLAAALVPDLRSIADRLEEELGPWTA